MNDKVTINGAEFPVEVTWAVLVGFFQKAGIQDTKDIDFSQIDMDAMVWLIWAAVRAGCRRQKITPPTIQDVEFAPDGLKMMQDFLVIFTRQTTAMVPADAKKN